MEEPHVEKKWLGTDSKLSKKRKTEMMQTKSKDKVKERNRVRKFQKASSHLSSFQTGHFSICILAFLTENLSLMYFSSFPPISEEEISFNYLMLPLLLIYLPLLATSIFLSSQIFLLSIFKYNHIIICWNKRLYTTLPFTKNSSLALSNPKLPKECFTSTILTYFNQGCSALILLNYFMSF